MDLAVTGLSGSADAERGGLLPLEEARAQLAAMSGKVHRLLSAAVLYEDGKPIWRHVGLVRLKMRDMSILHWCPEFC